MSYIRPEALPVKWEKLNEAQRGTFEYMVNLIAEDIERLPHYSSQEPDTQDPFGWLDKDRANHLVFLDGKRGTGKTTILVSLVKATTPGLSRDFFPNPRPPRIGDRVDRVHGKLVWLEPIDMEPVPRTINLLGAILVRIEVACSRSGFKSVNNSEGLKYRGLLEPSPDYQKAIQELKRFQRNMALAWEGNLPDRAGQLDPQAYAVDLVQIEKARLMLNSDLKKVLDQLAKHAFQGPQIHEPLFVLPIEDFDLNPLSSLELLRLLRMISVPRLLTVVLGDLTVVDVILNLKFSNNLAQVGRLAVGEFAKGNDGMLSVSPSEVAAMAGEITANALRKLVPPNQRILLRSMTLEEALNFRPLDRPVDSPDELRLHEMLDKCQIKIGEHVFSRGTRIEENRRRYSICGHWIESLRDFILVKGLFVVPLSSEDEVRKKEIDWDPDKRWDFYSPGMGIIKPEQLTYRAYSARHVFETTPRRLTDIWIAIKCFVDLIEHEIKNASADSGNDNASSRPRLGEDAEKRIQSQGVELIARLCRTIVCEEAALSPNIRREFERTLTRTSWGEWEVGRLPVSVISVTDQGYSVEYSSARDGTAASNIIEEHGTQIEIHVYCAQEWRFEVKEDKGPRLRTIHPEKDSWPKASLSPEAAGALVFLHDFLVLGPYRTPLVSPLLEVKEDVELSWAVTRWHYSGLTAEIVWPVPPCQSFWGLDLFRSAWNHAATEIQRRMKSPSGKEEEENFLRSLAFAWISAGCAVIDAEKEPITTFEGVVPRKEEWRRLHDRLEKFTPSSNDHRIYTRQVQIWLVNVALLMMPEIGLPDPLFNTKDFNPEKSKLVNFWRKHWQGIVQRRNSRLEPMLESEMRELAEKLKNELPAWLKEEKDQEPPGKGTSPCGS